MSNEWTTPEHAKAYLERADKVPHRGEGESTLLSEVPVDSQRILDLGCGDGRLLAKVLAHCPQATGVGLDVSPTMLTEAHRRFGDDPRCTLLLHDLDKPLPDLGQFDGVVSSFAIHHCAHQRKREIYAEVFSRLDPQGVFCNLEHVSSPTEQLHRRFMAEMGVADKEEDPSNKLLDTETQLDWLRQIGFEHVDCHWKWRELALLAGRKPSQADSTATSSNAVKQVIVMRNDLNMRRGKQIAQGAHASMSFLSRRLRRDAALSLRDLSEPQQRWLNESFVKVCCRVDSDEELLQVHEKAVAAGLEVHLITDSGRTEFRNQPTRTCLAIGPAEADRIDVITGHLQLL